MSSLKRTEQNAQQSAVVLLVSTIIVKIISACFKIPLSYNSFLGDLGFGYFSVAYDLFSPFYILAISGLPSALSHIIAEFVAQKRFADIKSTFKITRRLFIIFGAVFSVVISLLAIPFVRFTDNSGNTFYSVYAVIPSIFLCFIISVYRGYFEGFKNMNPTAVSKIIEALGKLFLGLGFAFLVNRITGNPALAAGASMLGITTGTAIASLYLHIKYKAKGDLITEEELLQSKPQISQKSNIKLILSLALPMAFSSLITSAVTVIDALTVRSSLAGDIPVLYEEYKTAINSFNSYSAENLRMEDLPTFLYGLRSKAFTMFNLVPTLTLSLGVGALPVMSECWVKKDNLGVKRNLNTIIKFTSLIAFPSGLAFILLAKPIMALLYSSEGSVIVGGNLLTIFGFCAIFAGFVLPLTSVLQSLDLQFSVLGHIIIGVAIKIVLNLLLVGNVNFNIYGSAISTTVCYLYIFVIFLCKISKAIGGFEDIKNVFVKPLISSVICVVCAVGICSISDNSLVTVCAILVAVFAYVILVLVLKIFTKEEIFNLPKGKNVYNMLKKLKITP